MNNQRLPVVLVKEACQLCGKQEDGPILLGRRMVKSDKKTKLEEMQGQCIGYMEKPCKDCQEIMDQAILLIGIVESKTDDIKNPYRSGNKWGVSEDFVRRTFQPKELAEDVIKKRAAFFPAEAAEKMGFPDVNLEA